VANDAAFDHNIVGPADHDQVLDIIAPDQDKTAAGVNRLNIKNAKARLPGASVGHAAQELGARKAADDPGGEGDEHEDDDEGCHELDGQRHLAAKDLVHESHDLPVL
jgi:hypothetical protein